LESEEFLGKPLDLVNFSFDEEHDDHKIENIYDLIHIEMNKWNMSCLYFDGDPTYDIDDDSKVKSAKLLPIEQPYMYINYSNFWQRKEDIFTDLFQPSSVDLL
jgi:hypothetical protein